MPIELRLILILGSAADLIYMVRKVKKHKLQIEYTIFWVCFGIFLIVISIFPQIVYFFAKLLKIQSPSNLVLLFIIFILIMKQFLMTIEHSRLEIQVKELVEEIALSNKYKK